MRRRDFIGLLGGAVMLPPGMRAQQIERRVGVLLAYRESDAAGRGWVKAFRDGMAQFGWTEGRNVQLDLRWATTDLNIIEQNAKALVRCYHCSRQL